MTTIIADVDNFVAAQNLNRGQALADGEILPLDYDSLTGSVPTGGNSVSGISGIGSGAVTIALPAAARGNAVIVDGGISTTASTSGADTYSLLVDASGDLTLTDNNTGNSETVTGASYVLFDGAATNATGAYQSLYVIETGTNAEIAAMYNAALGRIPDLAGLEFYIDQFGTKALPDLHTLATYFMGSAEFKTLYPALQTPSDYGGPNDQAFINELYGQILHRTPTASEVHFYVNALQGTLTNSSGQPIAATDRATLLEYFTTSPENQKDIASWLINPANGAASFGTLTQQAAQTVLQSEAASGTINADSFANLPSTDQAGVFIGGGSVSVLGTNYYGSLGTAPGFGVGASNLTVNLSSQYYAAEIEAANVTINGVSSGGSVITIYNTSQVETPAGTLPASAGSGTINLFSNDNWIEVWGTNTVAVKTIVNGWNSTDVFSGTAAGTPSTVSTYASLLAQPDGILYQGSVNSPISGTTIGGQNLGTWFVNHVLAVNVGAISNDSVSTIVAAANAVYKVGDIGTVNQQNSESAFFFGQDPQGNTMVFYWHGDSTHAGTILASDITGAVELVGVQASSLTSNNFHH